MDRRALSDLGIRFACAIVATLVISPFAAWALPGIKAHRIITRVFMASLILAVSIRRVRTIGWPAQFERLGLVGPHRARRFWIGVAVSFLLMVLMLAVSWALGGREPGPPHHKHVLVHLVGACASAVIVSFLEEILCRGYLKNVLGGFLSAALYAGAHYFKPVAGSPPAGEGFDPLFGFKNLHWMVEAWSVPQNATLGFGGLLLFGMALNRLRERTGSLYLGIGIHAGLVFALTYYRRFLGPDTPGSRWIFGGARLHDGVLGVAMLALVFAAAYWMPLPRRLRESPRSEPR